MENKVEQYLKDTEQMFTGYIDQFIQQAGLSRQQYEYYVESVDQIPRKPTLKKISKDN